MKDIDQQLEERPLSEIFEIRSANDWIKQSKPTPVPKMLFGDFWLEGELAILFADTGKGKSLLAVQIAESIAGGSEIAPLRMTAKPQEVLYLDFELTAKQFEMRYAQDRSERDEHLKGHYRFSNNFCRLQVKLGSIVPKGYYTFDRFLQHSIERLVKETGSKILIIDNITYLKRSNESTREAIPLMRELKRLKEIYGLSILVLAHTPKRDNSRPITVNDLQGSKILSNFADNIFAIGQSKLEAAGRYIKHIKPRSTGLTYDSTNVPYFHITKLNGNFLGFEHHGFASETVHLQDARSKQEWELIQTIKKMSETGMTIRDIAFELRISKSHVHRLLSVWMPEMCPVKTENSVQNVERPQSQEFDPTQAMYYFPGREEYDALSEEIGFIEHLDKPDPESQKRVRQAWVLERVKAEAHRIFERTGTAPPLADMLAKCPEFEGMSQKSET